MEPKTFIMILVGLFGVLLTILGLQGVAGGEWTTIGQEVTAVIILIGFLGIVVGVMVRR